MRLLAAFCVLAALTIAVVVAWLAFLRPSRTVVHDRRVVTVPIVSTPLTPLQRKAVRDSGPKNNAAAKKKARRSGPPSERSSGAANATPTGAQNRRVPVKKRQTPRTKPERRRSPQRPVYTPQAPSPQPSPSPSPQRPPSVTVPVPVTVCTPAVDVNC